MKISDLYSKFTGIAEMNKEELIQEKESCLSDIETLNSGLIFLPLSTINSKTKEAKEKIKLIDFRLKKIEG